jgi:hypothetical protein
MATLTLPPLRLKARPMPKKPDELSLRDRVVAALRLNRELIEHLEQGFVPKVHSLRRMTRPERPGSDTPATGDRTVHATASTVLEADNFSVEVYEQLIDYCESIRAAVQELTSEKLSQPKRSQQ